MNLFSTTMKRPARRSRTDEDFAIEPLPAEGVSPIPPATDRELLTLWLEHKDTAALESIILRHGPLVRSLSSRLLRSPHEQADAFQTVFLVVSQNGSRIRHRESLASWIYGVTVRTCLMFSRQRSHEPIPEEAEAPTFPRPEVLEHQELVLTLNKELDLLPAHLRESLVLVYLEGHSRQSAADLTNTTEQTIKSRLARGRNLLRSRLLKRGVTFSTAFTIFCVTTNSEAANLTISDQLLLRTIDTCQTGQLPLSFPAVPLDPIAIVPTGAPMISLTALYGGLAVATFLLLTTLGMGNHGRADGPETIAVPIDTSIQTQIPEVEEVASNVTLMEQIAVANPVPSLHVVEPVEQTSSTEKEVDKAASSSPVSDMELALLDREIALMKEAEKLYRDDSEKFGAMTPEAVKKAFGEWVDPQEGRQNRLDRIKTKLEYCSQRIAELEATRQTLVDSSRSNVLHGIELQAEESKLRLQLDSALAEYERLLDLRLRLLGYNVEMKALVENLYEESIPNPEEKITRLKSEIPALKAKIIDLNQQHAQVKAKLNAPVGSAVRTIEPPTSPAAPTAVADLSPNPTGSQPAADLPPIKQYEQSLLDLKVERAEMREKNARELAESGSGLASSNDLKLRLMDAKIALQEALLEREQFRVIENVQRTDKPSSPLAATSLNRNDDNLSKTSPGNKQDKTKLAEFYLVDEAGKRLSEMPTLDIDDFKGVNLGGSGEITFVVDKLARPKIQEVLKQHLGHRFIALIGNKEYPVDVTANAWIVTSTVTHSDAKQILAYFDGRGVAVKNAELSSERLDSSAQSPISNDKLTIRLSSEVPMTAIFKDPADPAKEVKLDINDSRSSNVLGEFPKTRTEIVFQTKSQTSEETFSFPVVLEFRDGIDFSKIPSFFNSVQIDLTQSDYELLRQSRLEVYLYTVERPGRKQIGENGKFVDGPNTTMCIALPRGRADNARLSDEAFRKVVESKKNIIATLRSEALTPAVPQTSNPPPPASSEASPTPKTIGVKFSNDFNATIAFDKLAVSEAGPGATQQVSAGVHPVTLTYQSSDNDQAFSQPLILEVLPDIEELDVGEIAGEFRLTLDDLALMQRGLFGLALVVYNTPNNRITASGRVGSGANVSQMNTILDLETIRTTAKDISTSQGAFIRGDQRTGRIVAILHSPRYDEQIKFRHEFYSPGRNRGGFGGGRRQWTLLTPGGIPEPGTMVSLYKVNADATTLDALKIEMVEELYKIDQINAAEIFLSKENSPDTQTYPISLLATLQRLNDKELILVPKDKYTPEALTTEIWNILHPPPKN